MDKNKINGRIFKQSKDNSRQTKRNRKGFQMIINQKVTDDIKSYIQVALVENCDKEKLKKWKKVIKYAPSKKRKQGLHI